METKDKLRLLWRDQRSWKVRLPLAALCAFACAFTFLIFGPCEIYAQNRQEMQFPFAVLLPVVCLAGVLVFAVLLGILALLRGKVFNLAVSVLFTWTLAGYLQGNFWNIDHGALTGDAVSWLKYKLPMLKNFLAWLFVLAAVLLLLYLSRKMWTKGIEWISVIIIGAQAVALVSLMAGGDSGKLWKAGMGEAYVSRGGIYEVSKEQNVIVFLLDRLDNRYTDELLELHPEWWDELSGFTYYHNYTGSYANTRPSITYLLTGVQHDYSVQWDEYFHRAWTEPVYQLLPDIHKKGGRIGVYSDSAYVFGDVEDVRDFTDNVHGAERSFHRVLMLKRMLELSAYRYFPEAMKPYFQISNGDLNDIVSVSGDGVGNDIYTVNDVAFWQGYQDQGLSVNPKSKRGFLFYHLDAAHASYMDENAQPVAEGGTAYRQVAGNMNMIFRYMDDLKEKGLYDDATIIITTDHARPPGGAGNISDVSESRVSTLMIKPAGAAGDQRMQISNKQVCQDNLRASIASYFGLDMASYGRTVEEIGEDEQVTRTMWTRGEKGAVENQLFTFRIEGDANDFSNWELTGTATMAYPAL